VEKVAEAEVLGDRGNLEEQVALERKEEEVEEEVVMAEVMEDQDNLEEVVVVEVDGEDMVSLCCRIIQWHPITFFYIYIIFQLP
jgi:hypothetical protein